MHCARMGPRGLREVNFGVSMCTCAGLHLELTLLMLKCSTLRGVLNETMSTDHLDLHMDVCSLGSACSLRMGRHVQTKCGARASMHMLPDQVLVIIRMHERN